MNIISLLLIELKKIRRSKILPVLAAAAVILWIPSILNAHLNFEMQAEGISPEYNFFIQGFLGMSWFMFPASILVGTVLLNMTERNNNGIQKMLSLPVSSTSLCLSKFIVLLLLAAFQVLITVAMYYVSAGIVSHTQDYYFLLSPLFVLKEAGILLLAAIPLLSVFWLLTVCIPKPIFSIGIGLLSIVPSVLVINTKAWFAYPICYPMFVLTAKYGKLAVNLTTSPVSLFPWIPVAVGITVVCLLISCLCFGWVERS